MRLGLSGSRVDSRVARLAFAPASLRIPLLRFLRYDCRGRRGALGLQPVRSEGIQEPFGNACWGRALARPPRRPPSAFRWRETEGLRPSDPTHSFTASPLCGTWSCPPREPVERFAGRRREVLAKAEWTHGAYGTYATNATHAVFVAPVPPILRSPAVSHIETPKGQGGFAALSRLARRLHRTRRTFDC